VRVEFVATLNWVETTLSKKQTKTIAVWYEIKRALLTFIFKAVTRTSIAQ